MEPKTLQTVAKEICDTFLGQRIERDLDRLRDMHAGLLRIDLLTGECTVDDLHIEPLEIASDLQAMLEPELKKLGLRTEDVTTADLLSKFTSEVRASQSKTSLRLECSSRIEAFGRDYVARENSERQLA